MQTQVPFSMTADTKLFYFFAIILLYFPDALSILDKTDEELYKMEKEQEWDRSKFSPPFLFYLQSHKNVSAFVRMCCLLVLWFIQM